MRAVLAHSARALDGERRQSQDQQQHAELEGWKLKPGSGMRRCEPPAPPPGAGKREHREVQHDHQAVDDVAELTQSRVVEAADHEREHHARVRRRSPGACTPPRRDGRSARGARRPSRASRPIAASSSSGSSRSRYPVPPPPDGSSVIWIGVVVLIGRVEVPLLNGPGLPRNHCDRICRATGAAATSPKPPFSTSRRRRSAWSSRSRGRSRRTRRPRGWTELLPSYCAVPVLP